MASFVAPEISKTLQFINDSLEDREWFAGQAISGADFQMSFPLEAGVANGTINDQYPNIMRYVKQIQARPGYLKALEKGGDYDYGPRNP
jgi:glutathione S-transferase